jgi:magnesium transporter
MAQKQKRLLRQAKVLLKAGQTQNLNALLNKHRSSDIAEVVELLDNEQRRIIFDELDKELSAEVLEKVDEATRAELFELFRAEELSSLVSWLDPDDAADLLAELPEEQTIEVLEYIAAEESAKIKDLMKYSEDSAGGIMDPVVISVPEDATVTEAIDKIRAAEIDEDFFSVYVVDKAGKFLGDVRIRLLLTTGRGSKHIQQERPDCRAGAQQESQTHRPNHSRPYH